jgi:hypothetical protein
VFAQNLVSAAASAGSNLADRKRYVGVTQDYAAGGEDRDAPGFAFAAAIDAERTVTSGTAT